AVATRWMAPESAATLAVIGSGRQALGQVAAVALVRAIRRVRAFSPTAAHLHAFVERVRGRLPDVAVEAAGSARHALESADVVVTVTRARDPFVTAAALAADVHVNAVGAITPKRAELAPDV